MARIVMSATGAEALTFDDVLLQPGHSEVMPGQTNIATRIARDIELSLPILSSAMDTVTESRLAIAMAQSGGLGVLHRNMTIEEQADEVRAVKRYESGMVVNPVTVGPQTTLGEVREIVAAKKITGFPVVDPATGALKVANIPGADGKSLAAEVTSALGLPCVVVNDADAFVLALGSYSPALAAPLGIRLPVYPVKGYSITVPIMDDSLAPVSTVMDETHKIAITRLGDRIRVGGMAEIAGFDLSLNPKRRATLEHSVEDLFGGAGDQSRATFWTGLRPMTPDGTPIVGGTALRNLFLNTGHGTLGWTLCLGAAEALARRLTGDNAVGVVSYGTEAGQFQEAGYSAIVCGPGDIAQAHQPDEFLEISEFEAGQRFMERLLAECA